MSRALLNIGRVAASVIALFAMWFLGSYLGSQIFSESPMVNKGESLASKISASIAIMAAALLLRRYVLRSFVAAIIALAATECFVFLIIGAVSRLWLDFQFTFGWLYGLTWNVIVAYIAGAVVGHLWSRRAANTALEPTPTAP